MGGFLKSARSEGHLAKPLDKGGQTGKRLLAVDQDQIEGWSGLFLPTAE